ncbi:MAG: 50S ribosomal protein L24 [Patescibacteria group bacterium]|nr:50S ribosomal protein L24 [Patescibacteria group bacterium]
MIKVKIGDTIKVTIGKDKGREGIVESVNPKDMTIIVQGINMYKKHVKGVPGREGGIYDIARPLPFGKFAIVCPKCKKQTRIGFSVIDNTKVRICKKCKREIDKN